jgi:hypothetical protein
VGGRDEDMCCEEVGPEVLAREEPPRISCIAFDLRMHESKRFIRTETNIVYTINNNSDNKHNQTAIMKLKIKEGEK